MNREKNIKSRKLKEVLHRILSGSCFFLVACLVLGFIIKLLFTGIPYLDLNFLVAFSSRLADKAGIASALSGTFYVTGLTMLIAFPLAVLSAIWALYYTKRKTVQILFHWMVSNLASVPSIVYGLFGLALFVNFLQFGSSILSGALTMSMVVLPIMIVTTYESFRMLPKTLYLQATALGVKKHTAILTLLFPVAIPQILTGFLLTFARALGETAPLLAVGAAGFIAYHPEGVLDSFTTLSVQIYDWSSRPQDVFKSNLAGAAILVLLGIMTVCSLFCMLLRTAIQRFWKLNYLDSNA